MDLIFDVHTLRHICARCEVFMIKPVDCNLYLKAHCACKKDNILQIQFNSLFHRSSQ